MRLRGQASVLVIINVLIDYTTFIQLPFLL